MKHYPGVARDGDFELTTNPKEAKTLNQLEGIKDLH